MSNNNQKKAYLSGSHPAWAIAVWILALTMNLWSTGAAAVPAIKVMPNVYYAPGFGNTYMVITEDGVVIIDTSAEQSAPEHYAALRKISNAPVKYILLTHAHGDHVGGIPEWREREPQAQIIAQADHVNFMHYRTRLTGFFESRNSLHFGIYENELPKPGGNPGNFSADIQADILFEDEYRFSLGGLTFELKHTPGETPDHMNIWIPELGAAFVGDNYYRAWPNIYSPRGTITRPALGWAAALDVVKAWEPELLLLNHGLPMIGKAKIQTALTNYQNSIKYVHDAVVQGMNDGKDVYSLMQSIELPEGLEQGQYYGRVSWAVRGIYEGYAGWFDGNIANLYSLAPTDVDPDLVELSGGAQTVVNQAQIRLDESKLVIALRLADAALGSEPNMIAAWQIRLEALNKLLQAATGSIEKGFLRGAIEEAEVRIVELEG